MANKTYVSPGVYTSEKDLTYVTRQVGVTTLGLAGETTMGPAFNPVFIQNYDEFKTFFGGQNPTKVQATGTLKYELPYIAKAYLSASNQLFVTRVLGLSGYDAGVAWAVTLTGALDGSTTGSTIPAASKADFFTYSADSTTKAIVSFVATEPLVQTLYNNGDLDSVFNTLGSKSVGGTGATTSVVWEKSNTTFSGVAFDYQVTATGTSGSYITGSASTASIAYYSGTSYSDVDNKVVALLRSRGTYDGDENLIFECSANTVTIDTNITTSVDNAKGIFRVNATSSKQGAVTYDLSFDVTSKNYITKVLGVNATDAKPALFVEEVYQNMLDDLIAEGKVYGLKTTLTQYASAYAKYQQQYSPAVTPYIVSEVRGTNIIRLFRLWTISDGNSANSLIKVSIENIRPDDKQFDVTIRAFSDLDEKPVVLEKFSRCTMDKTSTNFIGRRIGTLDGEFPSKSSYVMVELDEENDYSDAFPAGFLGVPVRDTDTAQAPSIVYKTEYNALENVRKAYLGLSSSIGFDPSFFTYKGVPDSATVNMWTGMTDGFHMDIQATGATIDGVEIPVDDSGTTYTPVFEFKTGNAEFKSELGVVGTDYENIKARKFTLAPYGGFDGWDIYRTRRTNTDAYARNGNKGNPDTNPNFIAYVMENGEQGSTSDYYAYLEAIRTFSNPESVNINVFATPGIDTFDNEKLINETIEMIETERADSLYIVTTPDYNTIGEKHTAEDVADTLSERYDSNYTCTYWPHVQIEDVENSQYVWIPPTRDVVRDIAIMDNVSYPWFVVAGINRGNVDCVKASLKLKLGDRDTLYDNRINPVTTISSEGVKIWGNKTLQEADTALNRINVRRLLLQTRKLISAVSLRLLFDQNDDVVRNQFLKLVNPILEGIRSSRGLTDFRVTVDSSPESIDRNELIGKVYIKPTKALEYIIVEFNLTNTGASFDAV